MRRTVMRYVNLSQTITLIMISPKVKKRFPTLDHLVEAGNARGNGSLLTLFQIYLIVMGMFTCFQVDFFFSFLLLYGIYFTTIECMETCYLHTGILLLINSIVIIVTILMLSNVTLTSLPLYSIVLYYIAFVPIFMYCTVKL